ncbi:SUKH-4 family immunity protein [Paenibacillus sp. MER 99-2]|uniref:SUKH-4 family immunity protein n=1 Tax=Paenibacillus sp. MER 99-2 TaxID=2939572 RepID=UPI00203D8EC9|nr:SUKH-4 family immunity protein [Paenibacillus sp. MER 99-2]MCM3174093.1 SUKH-4 family immunity protein [Paenibacillus sp. MER 99-2]
MEQQLTNVRYDKALVEAAQLPKETQELLLQLGLPQLRLADEHVLGVHFTPLTDQGLIQTSDGYKTLFPIGYEWEDSSIIFALETEIGTLYRLDGQKGEYSVVNTNLSLFLEFLHQYISFIHEHSRTSEPSVMTLEQVQAKLEAFRRGEIKPIAQPSSDSARKNALHQLRQFYTEKDPVSVSDEESWWSVVLEQLEDDLL